MGKLYSAQNPNKWLGAQATAVGVVPASAGPTLVDPLNFKNLLDFVDLQNRNSGTLNCALVGLLPDSFWKFATYVNVGPVITDDTVDAQDVGTGDVPLETTTTLDGFILEASVKFGAVSLNVSTAGVGASQTHTYKYWNGASWATLTPVLIAGPTSAGQVWTLGENVLLFNKPADWAAGGTSPAPQVATNYAIWVQIGTVGSTAALATRLYVGEVLLSASTVAAVPGAYNPTLTEVEIPPYIKAVQGVFSVISVPNTVHLGLMARNQPRYGRV